MVKKLTLILLLLVVLMISISNGTAIRGKTRNQPILELIVKAKCKKYEDDLLKSIQISKYNDGGCLPISLIDSRNDVNDTRATFSCINLDKKKSLFTIHQFIPKYNKDYSEEDANWKSSSKEVSIVSLTLDYPFIESTKTFDYLKKPSCKVKNDACSSSSQIVDYCKENKVILKDDYVSEGKERVYLIPPNLKIESCFLESGCCPYVSKYKSGICGGNQRYIQKSKNCDDKNACTIDRYDSENGKCVHSPLKCDDNNVCTFDSCHPQMGCTFTCIGCNDEDACTSDSCHPELGCLFNTIKCDDNNACTTDSCNSEMGCFFTSLKCDDNLDCTEDSCDTKKGCIFTPNNTKCDDKDECTDDVCNAVTKKCEHIRSKSDVCNTFFTKPNDVNCENPLNIYSSKCESPLSYDENTGACYDGKTNFISGDYSQMVPQVVINSISFVAWISYNYSPMIVSFQIKDGCSGTTICDNSNIYIQCGYIDSTSLNGATFYLYSCKVTLNQPCDLTIGGPYYIYLEKISFIDPSTIIGFDSKNNGCGCSTDKTALLKIN